MYFQFCLFVLTLSSDGCIQYSILMYSMVRTLPVEHRAINCTVFSRTTVFAIISKNTRTSLVRVLQNMYDFQDYLQEHSSLARTNFLLRVLNILRRVSFVREKMKNSK